jgi:hypothetical protein
MAALAGASSLAAQEPATIRPGMTEAQVRAAWGQPVTARSRGTYTYLFYENGCLRRCGTYDVVVLEGGQVVDAIVRAPEHRYDGVSSSPPDREPRFTQPAGDSTVKTELLP